MKPCHFQSSSSRSIGTVTECSVVAMCNLSLMDRGLTATSGALRMVLEETVHMDEAEWDLVPVQGEDWACLVVRSKETMLMVAVKMCRGRMS
jgi:hypothetical protein